MDCSPPAFSVRGDSPGKNTGVGCLPPGGLPSPGIKPGSPTLQVDSSPSKLPGKPLFFYAYFKLLRSLNDPPWFHSFFFLILRISFYYSVKMWKMVLITDLVLSMVLFFLCSLRGELTMDSHLQIHVSCNY